MKTPYIRSISAVALGIVCLLAIAFMAARHATASDAGPQLIQPAEMAKLLQAPKDRQPLIIQVGFRTLYEQAHIPGSEYIGPTSETGRLAGVA